MNNPILPRLFVTYKEAARIIGVSESLIKKMVRLGDLKAVKFGRAARIPISELEKLVDRGI